MRSRLVSEGAARKASTVCEWLRVSRAMVCGRRCDILPGRRFTVYLPAKGGNVREPTAALGNAFFSKKKPEMNGSQIREQPRNSEVRSENSRGIAK